MEKKWSLRIENEEFILTHDATNKTIKQSHEKFEGLLSYLLGAYEWETLFFQIKIPEGEFYVCCKNALTKPEHHIMIEVRNETNRYRIGPIIHFEKSSVISRETFVMEHGMYTLKPNKNAIPTAPPAFQQQRDRSPVRK